MSTLGDLFPVFWSAERMEKRRHVMSLLAQGLSPRLPLLLEVSTPYEARNISRGACIWHASTLIARHYDVSAGDVRTVLNDLADDDGEAALELLDSPDGWARLGRIMAEALDAGRGTPALAVAIN